jgi:3-oxoacid CoA-transferase subunit A
MERGLKVDVAFVKAWKGDRMGNLVYGKTARNFNPMMATAAKVTTAEVEQLVEVGRLDGDLIHTPSLYGKRIFQANCTRSGLRAIRTVRTSRNMQCAPDRCIGTFGLVVLPLVPFPFASPTRFSSSVRKPG